MILSRQNATTNGKIYFAPVIPQAKESHTESKEMGQEMVKKTERMRDRNKSLNLVVFKNTYPNL